MPFQHEEHHEIRPFWSWIIVVAFCVVIILWGLLNWRLIPDPPRRWDMGALRDVPSQSIYSTANPPPAPTPAARQIAPLPEANPLIPRDRMSETTP